LWLAALLLVVVGAKLWLIQACGTPAPYGDQWTEADRFLKPWLAGHLSWGAWFAPHNNHRIFFTRLLDLILIEGNGQWDPWLQMTVNAGLHAVFAGGLVYGLWAFAGRPDPGLFCLLLAPFFALPFAAENTLWGFQSQFYFLLIFALLAMTGLGVCRPGSPGWLAGLAAAGLGLFTMASGFLTPLAVVGLLGLRAAQPNLRRRSDWITLGVCLGVFAVGAALNPSLAGTGIPSGQSWGSRLATLAWNLAWPFENRPPMLLFVCAPLAITAIQYVQGRCRHPRAAEFLLMLGCWGGLQSAALAFARTGQVNSSRYADLFSVLPIASLASLFILGEGAAVSLRVRGWRTGLAVGWAVILLAGVWRISPMDWRNYDDADNYPLWSTQNRLVQLEHLRAFVATQDPALRLHDADAAQWTNTLFDSNLARILPPVCRPSLPIEKGPGSEAAWVVDGCPPDWPAGEFVRAWGNVAANGRAAAGRFVSQPLTATLPRLEMQLLCLPPTEAASIELVETASGRRFPVRPRVFGRWDTVIVDTPPSPFRVEITAWSPAAAVAVGDVKELGRLSGCARALIQHGVEMLLAGLSLMVALAGWAVYRRRADFSPYPAIRWLALAVAVAAWVGVWLARHAGAPRLTSELYANCAQHAVQNGHPKEASQLLREARWLEPEARAVPDGQAAP
jgi:hypothetical protein